MSGNNQQQLSAMLQDIAKRPGNLVCAECPQEDPTYCSFLKPVATRETIAVFVCEGCSKHHKRLGMHFSEGVKSVEGSEWTRREISILHKTGNEFVNAFYEATGGVYDDKDIEPEDPKLRSAFIKTKYIRRKFFSSEKYHEEKCKRDEKLQQQQQQQPRQRRHTMAAGTANRKTEPSTLKKAESSSALERNLREKKSDTTTPATPRTQRRRRATLASTTSTRQQQAMLANLKNTDLSDVMEPEESEPESEPEEPSQRALTLEQKSLSTRSLMSAQNNAPAPPSLQAMRERSLAEKNNNNNSNMMALPSGLTTPQKARASIGLDMFLTLSQEKEEEEEGKKDKKGGRRAKKFMRRCMSVTGTDDTRKPVKKEEEEESVNSTPEEEAPQMYGDKVATFEVDAEKDVQRLKAAKLAKKSRKARRRASVAVMPSEGKPSSRRTKSPHDGNHKRRTKSPAQSTSTSSPREKRDSPSPTSVREETRMSQSLYEQPNDMNPEEEEEEETHDKPMSQSERLQAKLSSTRANRAARRAGARGGGGPAIAPSESEAESELEYETPQTMMCQSERQPSSRADRAARRERSRRGPRVLNVRNPPKAEESESEVETDLEYETTPMMSQSGRLDAKVTSRRAARRASGRGLGPRILSVANPPKAEEAQSEVESDLEYETPQSMMCQSERQPSSRADRAARRASLRGAVKDDPLRDSNHSINRIRARRGSLRGAAPAEPQQRSSSRRDDPLSLSNHSTRNTHRAAPSKPLLREGSDPTLRDRRERRNGRERRVRKCKTMNEGMEPAAPSTSSSSTTTSDRRSMRRSRTISGKTTSGEDDRSKRGTRRLAKRVSSNRLKEEPDHKWDNNDNKKAEEPDFQWNKSEEGTVATKKDCSSLASAFKIPTSSQVTIGAGRRASVSGEIQPRRGGPRKRSQSMLPPKTDKPYENQLIQQWHSGAWPSEEDEARAAEKLEEELAPGGASKRRTSRRHASTGGVRKSRARS